MARTAPTTVSRPARSSELVDIDPAALLVDLNVRHDNRLDPDFCASIAEHGVLVPVVAVRTTDGILRVRYGHRRTLAAAQAGCPTVPVVVVADEATDDAATVERLVTQWAENEHRTGLTTAERADVIGQLSAFGVSPTQIARRTRASKTEVASALAVHGSELARAATARYGFLDLTQAAVVAEFDADTEAVKALVVAAREGRFDHVAQRLRDDRRDAAARAAVADGLREQGVRVIDRPAPGDTAAELHRLADGDGTRLTAATHESCPGHAAYIGQEHGWVTVDANGQPLGEDSDGDGEDEGYLDDEDDPEVGGGAPRREWSSWAAPRWVCTDPAAHGHTDTWATHGGSGSGGGRVQVDQLTDVEREAARVVRRDVIESNKAWGSAQTVRREWLRGLACRKTAPKGSAGFLAAALAVDADLLADVGGNHLAADLLGIETDSYGRSAALAQLVAAASDTRALLLALVQVLAAYEARTDRNDWRHPRAFTGRYLTHLKALGYTLADVEHRACGHDPAPTTDSDQDD